jgi:hypothetical protein
MLGTSMTTAERIWQIADAIASNAAAGELLKVDDQVAIAAALRAEADRITTLRSQRALRAWATRRAS